MSIQLDGSAGLTLPDGSTLNLTDNRAGELFDFSGSTPPSYAIARPLAPTNISRATYPKLFAAIGTTWGAGDGSTTFGCPYCPANQVDVQANANIATNTVGAVLNHSHLFNAVGSAGSGATNGIVNVANGAPQGGYATDNNSGGFTANLPAGMRVLKCVRIR